MDELRSSLMEKRMRRGGICFVFMLVILLLIFIIIISISSVYLLSALGVSAGMAAHLPSLLLLVLAAELTFELFEW